MTIVISGPQVHVVGGVLTSTDVVIDDQKIQALMPTGTTHAAAQVLRFPETWHLIPGMIDLHIHGVAGKDVMDSADDVTALPLISAALPAEGVTAFLATTITAAPAVVEQVLQTASEYIHAQTTLGAEILGINLEGPFLAAAKCGTQARNLIIPPNLDLFKQWQRVTSDLIKIVTIAPEMPHALPLIAYLKTQGIIAALGHSNATYEQAITAIKTGVSHATHLFNAMRGVSQRDPGGIIALLLSDYISVEVIADGVHLHPAICQLILRIKPLEEIILITDAMRAKGMPNGEYDLGGQLVTVVDGVAQLKDGTLAGSVLKMDSALRNIMRFTGCSLTEAIAMTAENPAKRLNLFERKGSIALDKDADLVVLDEDYQVKCTVCRGEVAYATG